MAKMYFFCTSSAQTYILLCTNIHTLTHTHLLYHDINIKHHIWMSRHDCSSRRRKSFLSHKQPISWEQPPNPHCPSPSNACWWILLPGHKVAVRPVKEISLQLSAQPIDWRLSSPRATHTCRRPKAPGETWPRGTVPPLMLWFHKGTHSHLIKAHW